jgi:hypothetical protein
VTGAAITLSSLLRRHYRSDALEVSYLDFSGRDNRDGLHFHGFAITGDPKRRFTTCVPLVSNSTSFGPLNHSDTVDFQPPIFDHAFLPNGIALELSDGLRAARVGYVDRLDAGLSSV